MRRTRRVQCHVAGEQRSRRRSGSAATSATLFATIADRYDLITVVLSYGQDRRWKRRLVELAAAAAGRAWRSIWRPGTGDIAFALARTRRARRRSRRHAADDRAGAAKARIAGRAPRVSRRRHARAAVSGRVLRPRDDRLRPAERAAISTAAIDEIAARAEAGRSGPVARLQPAGERAASARLYLRYLTIVGGALGWLLHRDPDTYRYIPASIRNYPGAAAVARLMEARGFSRVRHHRSSAA